MTGQGTRSRELSDVGNHATPRYSSIALGRGGHMAGEPSHMEHRKRIALIAHDNRKEDLLD
jgi:hypothetical protein